MRNGCYLAAAAISLFFAAPALAAPADAKDSLRPDSIAADDIVDLDLSSDEITEINTDEDDGGGQNISGLLGASRDVYASQVDYNMFRFQERGYGSDYSSIYFNGFSLRDPETGYANYNVWGGLNDMTRFYTTQYGLEPSEASFGNFAGITSYNTKASNYRKQTSISLAAASQTYQFRAMVSTSSGMMENGWGYALSVSTRLGQGGYMDGTPQEAVSYFAAVEKRFLRRHSINITIIGAPRSYGLASAVTQEAYDLYGSYAYNPRWGYQDGKVRSANVRSLHIPIAMLNYTWNISDGQKLEAGVSLMAGRNGTSYLDWSEGNDPRPDYYRKFPSYWQGTNNPDMADYLAERWRARDAAVTQINWDALVAGNRNANAMKPAGDWQAMTIVSDRRKDQQTWRAFANYNKHFSRYLSLFGGVEMQRYKGMFYQTVLDALGADYYLNLDKYALTDNLLDIRKAYYDINDTDLKKHVGDKFGYDYEMYQNDYSGWAQVKASAGRFDFYAAGQAGYTEFWRRGIMNNGRFAAIGRSEGTSKKEQFARYAAKVNATFKITGRNYISLNGGFEQRPPLFANTYLQARYHDLTVEDYGMKIDNENIYSADMNYYHRGANLKLRASAYYTQSLNSSKITIYYMEGANSLVEYVAKGIDSRYMGIELGAAYKLSPTLTLEAALGHGIYTYTGNPQTAVIRDDESADVSAVKFRTAYIEGYHLSQRPGTIGTVSLTYRSPKYWMVGVTGTMAANTYIDIAYDRRTYEAISFLPGTPEYEKQLAQEKFPMGYGIDLFAGYSYRFRSNGSTLGFTANMTNLLDKNFKTGGYEQLRFDAAAIDKFPSKYYYTFGRTFFVQVYYRF